MIQASLTDEISEAFVFTDLLPAEPREFHQRRVPRHLLHGIDQF
jgi:hypothetical protein